MQSSVIRELRGQQAEVRRRQADLGTRYGPRHPQILTVNRELADIEVQIEAEIDRIVVNLDNEVRIANQRVQSIGSSLNQARNELAQNNSAIVRLRELEREAEASRALFESFLNRFRQTNETEGLAEADARIVTAASTPTSPSAPNVMLNLVLGLVLAGIAGAGVIALFELLDNGLHTENDVETQLGMAHIASLPLIKTSLIARLSGRKSAMPTPADYVVDKPLSGFAEAVRTIRSAIRLSQVDRDHSVIAVSSAVPGEGKTTTVSALGRIAAMAGSKVLILDCDIRRRLLTKTLNDTVETGLLEVLNGEAQVSDVVIKDDKTDLDILPVAETTFTPRDVFGTQAFNELLTRLRDEYDMVVLDTAPILAVADTRAIAARVDAIILVAQWRKSAVGMVRKALQELLASNGNVLGVVLNSVDLEAQARYGYDTSGYYYRSYRNYYTD